MRSFDEDFPADLAVVGLGPAGLAAALRAAESGKRVIAFTDRSHYTRQQRCMLKRPNYIYDLIDRDKLHLKDKAAQDLTDDERADIKFYTRLESEKSVQIKDIENYLFRKLRHTHVTIIHTDHLNKISKLGSGFGCNYIELCGPPPQKYHCYHILAADGAKHLLADQVNLDLNKNISYTTRPFKPKHQYHATVQLELLKSDSLDTQPNPSTDVNSTYLSEEDRVERQARLQQWTSDTMPSFYIFCNDSKTKFCFTGEIPKAIFDEPDTALRKNKLKEWASTFISKRYGMPINKLIFKDYTGRSSDKHKQAKHEKKAMLQVSAFQIEGFRVCDQPLIDLNSGVFSSVGDARRSSYYLLTHGIQDGVALAVEFVDAVRGLGIPANVITDYRLV